MKRRHFLSALGLGAVAAALPAVALAKTDQADLVFKNDTTKEIARVDSISAGKVQELWDREIARQSEMRQLEDLYRSGLVSYSTMSGIVSGSMNAGSIKIVETG